MLQVAKALTLHPGLARQAAEDLSLHLGHPRCYHYLRRGTTRRRQRLLPPYPRQDLEDSEAETELRETARPERRCSLTQPSRHYREAERLTARHWIWSSIPDPVFTVLASVSSRTGWGSERGSLNLSMQNQVAYDSPRIGHKQCHIFHSCSLMIQDGKFFKSGKFLNLT